MGRFPTFSSLIVQEHPHWVLINKPSGLLVEQNPWEPSLESMCREYLEEKYRNPYVGIVHRLDRPTSGLLIMAKRKSALRKLNEMLARRQIRKSYWAISPRIEYASSGLLEHYLLRQPKQKKTKCFSSFQPGAKKAQLRYRFEQLDEDLLLWKIQLLTGRYHQIRAQLSHLGAPILGDELYGGKPHPSSAIALHAHQLKFPANDLDLPSSIQTFPTSNFPWTV